MRKNKIRILHVAQAAGGVDRYIRMLLKYLDKEDLNIPEDAFVVGMVGRISQQKAPDVFIKMAKQVKDEVPNAHFIIVGNGNQEDEIRKYAKDNGFSDSLHITG